VRLPAAEVRLEAWTTILSSRNVLRNFLDPPSPQTIRRRELFSSLPETIYLYPREARYALHAFVIMPEHFHLLLTPANDVTVERAIQLIKGAYSHELGSIIGRNSEVWQRGFTNHRVRDSADFIHYRDYVHRNPVERRLVINASEYRYCSAFPGFKLDLWPSAAEARFSKSA
jgi:putative transposase